MSLSPAGAAFLRKAVQQDTDLQYSALLRPIIETAIARQMAGIATRLTGFLSGLPSMLAKHEAWSPIFSAASKE